MFYEAEIKCMITLHSEFQVTRSKQNVCANIAEICQVKLFNIINGLFQIIDRNPS